MTFPFPQFQPAAPSSGGAWTGPTSGLIHRWPMDDANVSGSTILDVVGSINGTAQAGISSTTGPQATDTARAFNGSSTGYISFPSMPISGSPLSLFTWLKFNSRVSGPASPYVVVFIGTPTSGASYFLSADSNYPLFCAGTVNTTLCLRSNTQSFNNTSWHHFGYTYDGTALTGYMDGSAIGSTTGDTGWTVNANHFSMGREVGQSDYFNGALKQCVIYNRALSSSDVTQLYGAY